MPLATSAEPVAGAPTPEALRARVAFLAETMTSVLREFDARLQRAGGHATRMLGDGGKNPATREEVDALPTRAAGDADCARCSDASGAACDGRTADGVDAQGPQCYVCLGDFEPGEEIRALPCHRFHRECVDRWLLGSSRHCPTCRARVPAVKAKEEEDADADAAAVDERLARLREPVTPGLLFLPAPASA